MRFLTTSLPFTMMAALSFGSALHAQEREVWIQIEAKPNLAEAMARAEIFAQSFPQTQGFEMASGWFGIALGPYPESMAQENLLSLKAQGLIPADSYINTGRDYLAQYFSASAAPFTQAPAVVEERPNPFAPIGEYPDPSTEPGALLPLETPAEPMMPFGISPVETTGVGESLEEAQGFEASLTPEAKREIQEALQWHRHYASTIDGAFGKGSREAIKQWQMGRGYGGTGILSRAQYEELISTYRSESGEYGFETVTLAEAGITARLPMNLVEFDRFEPPFVHYKEKNGSGLRLSLISKPGDQAQLGAIYAQVQNIEGIPTEGSRELTDMDFAIEGRSPVELGFAYGILKAGAIKGWLISTSPANQLRDTRVIEALRESFTTSKDYLDPGMVPLEPDARKGLLEGLEEGGSPHYSASGFYIDAAGSVATHAALVQNCSRITIDRLTEAKVAYSGGALAVLKPLTPLAPAAFATLGAQPTQGPAFGAGYSYGERLPAAVLLNGEIAALQGLGGEPEQLQLAMNVLAGDAGGPLLDGSGALLGMILPNADESRQLPKGLGLALGAPALAAEIAKAGISLAQGVSTPLARHQLTQKASAMSVLVSCWQ